MKIAICSGKGGTGKTFISTNLTYSISSILTQKILHIDCDVEEPNSNLFLKINLENNYDSCIEIPEIDQSKCTACGECGKICQFKAIISTGKNVLTFPEICHSCGGCFLVCQENAIKEKSHSIGTISKGIKENITFIQGKLKIGSIMSVPIIRHLKKLLLDYSNSDITILDCPPGTTCPTIESIKNTDFVILVTEPTPFGLNDLKLAIDMVKELKLPFGVIINKSDIGNKETFNYCKKEQIPILMELPFKKEISECYSKGYIFAENKKEYIPLFLNLINNIKKVLKI